MESKVYIVDDDEYARESLQWLIESVNLDVISFNNGQSFLDKTQADITGCLILDVRMPGINGMDLFTKIRSINYSLPVIIMTGHADVSLAVRAMKAGVFDFIEKPYNDSLMIEQVQNAIDFDRNNQLERDQISKINTRISSLTPREIQVLNYVLESMPNKIIADKLNISIKTVELHRSNLMTKMKVASATELVRQIMIVNYMQNHHKEELLSCV